jgi:two-component system sensor histidine kinase ChiS
MANNSNLVLIVDDSQILRSMLKSILEKSGFQILEATTGEEAIELIAKNNIPDIILLDVEMPGMGGFAACQKIRELPQGQDLPIMMVTGLEDLSSIENAYNAGATDFTTKPINWDLIGYRVRFMVRNSKNAKKN